MKFARPVSLRRIAAHPGWMVERISSRRPGKSAGYLNHSGGWSRENWATVFPSDAEAMAAATGARGARVVRLVAIVPSKRLPIR